MSLNFEKRRRACVAEVAGKDGRAFDEQDSGAGAIDRDAGLGVGEEVLQGRQDLADSEGPQGWSQGVAGSRLGSVG